jgi:hypothetical protein
MKLQLVLSDAAREELAEAIARKLAELPPRASEGTRGETELKMISAREAGVPSTTWRKARIAGELPMVPMGWEYRARRCDVDAWLATLRVQPDTSQAPSSKPEDPVDKALRSGKLRPIKGGRP